MQAMALISVLCGRSAWAEFGKRYILLMDGCRKSLGIRLWLKWELAQVILIIYYLNILSKQSI